MQGFVDAFGGAARRGLFRRFRSCLRFTARGMISAGIEGLGRFDAVVVESNWVKRRRRLTLILELTKEQEARLRRRAKRAGLPVEEFAMQVLDREADSEPQPRTGAQLVDYLDREGVIGIWADRTDIPDSPEFARQLRSQGETRT